MTALLWTVAQFTWAAVAAVLGVLVLAALVALCYLLVVIWYHGEAKDIPTVVRQAHPEWQRPA